MKTNVSLEEALDSIFTTSEVLENVAGIYSDYKEVKAALLPVFQRYPKRVPIGSEDTIIDFMVDCVRNGYIHVLEDSVVVSPVSLKNYTKSS